MPEILQYSSNEPRRPKLPLNVMIFGVVSGPLGIGLGIISKSIFPQSNDSVAQAIFACTLLIALLFAILADFEFGKEPRERTYLRIAICAPIVWAIAILGFIFFVVAVVKP